MLNAVRKRPQLFIPRDFQLACKITAKAQAIWICAKNGYETMKIGRDQGKTKSKWGFLQNVANPKMETQLIKTRSLTWVQLTRQSLRFKVNLGNLKSR